MGMSTRAELISSIGSWSNRGDLVSRAPDFIRLVEARLNRQLRVRQMVKRSTGQIASQYTALPNGFLEMKNLQINASVPYSLPIVPAHQADLLRTKRVGRTGKPECAVVLGTAFEVVPSPDDTYQMEMAWYGEIPALTEVNPTNWLLAKHPDAYLFGALVEAYPYLKEEERYPLWAERMSAAVEEINYESERAEFSGPLRIQFEPLG